MIGRRLAVGVVMLMAGASLGLTCGPAPPVTDVCVPEVGGPVPDANLTSLEIGTMADGRFTPFTDQGVAPLTIGGQGSDMVVTHLRLRGSDVPACLAQRTALEQLDGTELVTEQAAIKTAPDGAGGWVTGAMYLVYFGAPAQQIRLRSKVGTVERSVVVWAGSIGTIDAGTVDARGDAAVAPGP